MPTTTTRGGPTAALSHLQRDWVNAWPKFWPEASYAHRCGFQAGVNRVLSADATHTRETPQQNPHAPGTPEGETWTFAMHAGENYAGVILAQQHSTTRSAAHG